MSYSHYNAPWYGEDDDYISGEYDEESAEDMYWRALDQEEAEEFDW